MAYGNRVTGTVFLDQDADGLRESTDVGLSGITVRLVNSLGLVYATTTTAADGTYSFSEILPGTYRVQVVAPTGDDFSPVGTSTTTPNSVVSSTGSSPNFSVALNTTVSNQNAGLYEPVSVRGTAFTDLDNDGVVDTGESVRAGVTVRLLNAGGTVVSTTTTATNGTYSFTDLAPGTYSVQFVAPSGAVFSPRGTNTAPQPVGGSITAQNNLLTNGSFETTATGGRPGYAGWTVSGNTTSTPYGSGPGQGPEQALTDGKTAFATSGSSTNNYSGVVAPDDANPYYAGGSGTHAAFFVDDGAIETISQSVNLTTGQVYEVGFDVYQALPGSGNAGAFTLTARIGSQTLLIGGSNTGTIIAAGDWTHFASIFTAQTTGTVTFSLTYQTASGAAKDVLVDNVYVTAGQTTRDLTTSSQVETNGQTSSFTLTSGQSIGNQSAGLYFPPATITGNVFIDANADGSKAASDAGLSGQTVRLLSGSTVVATTTTDSSGNYTFGNLTAGTYTVQVVAASGSTFSPSGSSGSLPNSSVGSTGTASVTVANGATATVNAGEYAPATISGVAFTDANGDGIQGSGDSIIAGQTVQLLNAAGTVVATTTTGTTGAYSFTGIVPGSYQVQFVAAAGTSFTGQDQGSNDAVDSDVNTAGRSAVVTVTSGQTVANLSAGSYTPISISGTAFTDTNGDGVRGAGEGTVAGVTAQLLNAAGTVVATTTTNSSGAYSFTGVAPGTYSVQFTAPNGTVFTAQDQGTNDAVDSDVNPTTGRTGSIVLTSGGAATNVAAGLYTPATVSGVVFTDANADGIQGGADAGRTGVTVQLLNAAGAVVATTTSGTGGAYSFTGVAPGTYQVQFVSPTGTVFSPQDQGSNDAVDSDANVTTGRTASFTVASGGSVTNLSAGIYAPVSVSGTAFTDANGDGIQGTGEAGIAGQTVQLLNSAGTVVATTTTGTGGTYSFTGVVPGTYQVQFTAATGTRFTAQDQGGDDAVDSDVNATGRTAAITLTSGQAATNVSAGSYTPVSLSGQAFVDTNGDGIRGSGEAGTAGVAVQLLDSAGAVVATTTTGTGGAYSFTGVAPGSYRVQFTAPTGTAFTSQDVGTNDAVDSDVNPATGRTGLVTLTSGGSVANLSAGVFTPVSVSGTAFVDANGDGVQGSGETGTAGQTVQLLNSAGAVVATTTTGTGGAYSFTGVAPGTYQVQFAAASGAVFTAQDAGGNDAVDSDVNATGRTAAFTLASGQAAANISAGSYTPGTLSGLAFTDTNGDGIRNTGEAGPAGQTVQLLNSAGDIVATTTTGSGGAYSFTGVAPGTYRVQFTAPTGTVFTAQDQGTDDAVDSDAGANGRTASVTLSSGGTVSNLDAGTYTPVSVNGIAFTDANGDGIQGTGETGLAGQTVQLLNGAGTVVATTTTGTGGAYSFTGVAPGTYQVQFSAPSGTSFTAQDQGGNDAVDSDVGATGRSAAFTLASGQTAANLSAGLFTPATISGVAFTDTNGDGIQGAAESGQAGVAVRLLSTDGTVVATTTTGTGGAYSFTGVTPGSYQVQFVAPTGTAFTAQDVGANDAVDSDANPTTGRTGVLTVASGQATANVSAGLFVPGSASGFVFSDSDGNGVRDSGDPAVAGATVRLLNGDGTLVATTTTGSDGGYNFANLTPGQYQVQFVAPNGTVFTAQDQGSNDAIDSDANAATGRTALFTLASGQDVTDLAAGVFTPAATGTGNVFFVDANGNGIRDAGEGGVAGATVRLLNGAGAVVSTTTTDPDGIYSFAGVAPGTYYVQFVAPGGTVFTARDQGSNEALDSDVNPANGLSGSVVVSSGGTISNVGAGIYTPVTVSGLLFTDADGDGLRSSGEAGIAGQTVRLLNASGTVVATTTTGTGGAYSFTGQPPGGYQVQFVAPNGTVFTAQDQGNSDDNDSDANPATGRTGLITLASGQAQANVSAGVYAPVSLSGVAFTDTDGDGIQGSGETGTAGQTVQLLNSAGAVVATTTTGTGGAYSFTGIAPGTYQVQFAAAAGTVFTRQDVGTNDAVDSDVAPTTGRTAPITLASGQAATNISAGSYTPVTLGGTVFADTNGDGIRGTGEAGIAGQAVQLLNAAGTVVATTTTDADGAYNFAGIAPGSYQIGFVAPGGTVFTAQDQGANDAIDSDANPTTGRAGPIILSSGGSAANVSAGIFTATTISGTAFTDANGDGIQGSSEVGTAGQTVQLLNSAGTVVATTTTDSDGTYRFAGVTPGTYQVQFASPAGTSFTAQDQGGDDSVDSDVNGTGRTGPITLTSGQAAANVSAGTYTPARVSGLLFTDLNGDGIRATGEAGIAGQTVQLLNSAGTVVATTTTASNGTYSFGSVTPGQYQVQFTAPDGTVFSPQDQGGNDAVDSDANATGRTALLTLTSGQNLANVSAGAYAPTGISGQAFVDTNGDGIRGSGEAGTAGVAVQLLDSAGAVVATTTTGTGGAYSFTGVAPGSYRVQFTAPTGTAFTSQDVGTNDAVDSDVNPATGRTGLVTLTSGGSVANLSAGVFTPVSVSGTAFVDANGDGVQGSGETGTAGQTVQLLNSAGAVVATTTTGTGGAYSFTGVAPGTYQVQFAAASGAVFTAQDAGGNDAVDSDVNATGRTAAFTLASGQAAANISAGSYTPGTLSGLAFTDTNGDGIRNTGEAGLGGVSVRLLDASGAVVATTTSASSGTYSFRNVAPGQYQVQFVAPDGTVFTAQNQGANDVTDSEPDPTTGRTGLITVTSGQTAGNISSGFYTPVSVSGTAFVDTNGDGIQGTGETGAAGVTVQLLNSSGAVIATSTTDTNGAYRFTGIAPGTYSTQFVAPRGTVFTAQDQGTNDATDSDVNPTTGRSAAFTLASGGNVTDLSAGLFTAARVSGFAFTDTDGDGIRDSGEPGTPGVTVRLINAAGTVVATTTTGADGTYSFADVDPGTYRAQFVAPNGTVFSARDQGTNDARDSEVDANGLSSSFTVASGGSVTNLSAGTYRLANVSGVAFTDTNGDGIQGAGEAGTAGVAVQLVTTSGTVVATTTTGASGAYSFADVAPGNYQIRFTAPSGTVFTARDQGGDDALDSDVASNGRTGTISLTSGQSLGYVSAGTYTPGRIGGTGGVVFADTDADGIREASEPGIAGATVRLLDVNGNLVATATTASNGSYSFTGVAPGTYQLEFVAPNGTLLTAQDRGDNDTVDSDADQLNGRTALFEVVSGQVVSGIAAGVFSPATTGEGNIVFADTNGNGIRDSGEGGVAGVTVRLVNNVGDTVATTTTTADGTYSFDSFTPGQYQVEFTAPDGTVFTAAHQGSNNAVDSDADPTTGRSDTLNVLSGSTIANVGAGIYVPVSFSGEAFSDVNGNGLHDDGEAGLAGVTVRLVDRSGAIVSSTTTGAAGAYSFAGVAPGIYQVEFVAPTGAQFTGQNRGGDDDRDSDVNVTTGRTSSITLASGGIADHLAAGFVTSTSIDRSGSIVFNDLNGNGIRDAGEAGVADVTVRLLNAAGDRVATTTTNSGGTYAFSNILPGQYRIEVVAPSGTAFTQEDQGGDDTRDSDVDPSTGRSDLFTVTSDSSVYNVAAGLYTPTTIIRTGSIVFDDRNANGIRDAGEAGIANVTVRLLDADGSVVATTVTNSGGTYTFTGLQPGQYRIAVDAPTGRLFSPQNQGGDDARDSDINPATGLSDLFTVSPGTSVYNVAAGVFVPASVSGSGNIVFNDVNGNGIRDAGETGLAGVSVRLLDASGAVVASTTTGTGGTYGFDGIRPGEYRVQFVAPSGTGFSSQDQGANDARDSDANPGTGITDAFTLTAGQALNDVGAAIYTPVTLSRTGSIVFNDLNNNGIRDAGEAGIADVVVRLLDASGGLVATTTTNSGGTYSFVKVQPGQYRIEVVAPADTLFSAQNQGADDTRDSDVDPTSGRSDLFTITSDTTIYNVAAGLYTPPDTEVGGDVWLDVNGNGVRDAREPLLAGVEVRLLSADGVPLGPTTVTDTSGHYSFTGLDDGIYRVQFAPLIGTAFTAQDRGTNEALDSDAAPDTGISSLLVQITDGVVDLRSGAGLVLALSQTPAGSTVINLGDGNDGYPGNDQPEIVRGNGGNDNINGLGGNDTSYGDDGSDALNGHDGNDYLDGGRGDDNVQGQAGNDVILGGDGNDIGEGGSGNDTLMSGAGDDNMQGELGDDSLFGGDGDDLLTGNEGNDVVVGGDGSDSLQGADGLDLVIGGRDAGRMQLDAEGHVTGVGVGDVLEGNAGADRFIWQAGDGVDLLLDFNPNEGDTLTIYGYSGFSVIERTPEGRMALYLGPNAGFILNNDTFQGATTGSVLPGVEFIASNADAPRGIVNGNQIVPVLVENWISEFLGNGPINVSQGFPPDQVL
ncbi:SdrD B-like domain-containing protein [Muricoccus radiodurans]|uniref:SdrD B-like domain-containing protein n=1 Tax=Muricoccus radiodurans TaxID=2231721 RepID=UPI003CF62131